MNDSFRLDTGNSIFAYLMSLCCSAGGSYILGTELRELPATPLLNRSFQTGEIMCDIFLADIRTAFREVVEPVIRQLCHFDSY